MGSIGKALVSISELQILNLLRCDCGDAIYE